MPVLKPKNMPKLTESRHSKAKKQKERVDDLEKQVLLLATTLARLLVDYKEHQTLLPKNVTETEKILGNILTTNSAYLAKLMERLRDTPKARKASQSIIRCTACNKDIPVDETTEHGVCPNCETTFIV